MVLYDNYSICSSRTQSTGASSKLSKIFLFDTVLMNSPVYQRAVRSLFKRPRLPRRTEIVSSEASKSQTIRQKLRAVSALGVEWSKIIGSMLERDRAEMRRELKLAILGQPSDAMDAFTMLSKTIYHAGSQETLQELKIDVISIIFDYIHALLGDIEGERQLDQQSSIERFLRQAVSPANMTPELASDIQHVLQSADRVRLSDLASSLSLPM